MTTPYLPDFQFQGPADNCELDGKALGWLSCTTYAEAMQIDASTLGAKKPTGCEVRDAIVPRDTTGGTSLDQVAGAAYRGWGVSVDVRTGRNYATPTEAILAIDRGATGVVQISTGPTLGTPFASTRTPISHAVIAVDIRGYGSTAPDEVRVGDPANRRRAFEWWPWGLLTRAAAALQIYGEDDSRILGAGRMYVGIGPDKEPHYHRGAERGYLAQTGYPRRMIVTSPTRERRINVRSGPGTAFPVVDSLPRGTVVRVHGYVNGELFRGGTTPAGSDDWLTLDHAGTLYVHRSGLREATS